MQECEEELCPDTPRGKKGSVHESLIGVVNAKNLSLELPSHAVSMCEAKFSESGAVLAIAEGWRWSIWSFKPAVCQAHSSKCPRPTPMEIQVSQCEVPHGRQMQQQTQVVSTTNWNGSVDLRLWPCACLSCQFSN
eukprot:4133729-Amphidinium_carterae.1